VSSRAILVVRIRSRRQGDTHSLRRVVPSVTHKLRTVRELRDILVSNFKIFARTISPDPHRHAYPRALSRVLPALARRTACRGVNRLSWQNDDDNDMALKRQVVGAVVQLVEYRTRNREVAGSTHTRSTASNLEQVANLLCAQANSASHPQRDGK